MNRFRPNVAAVLQKDDGRILVGERVSIPGSWQFPQGGVNEGEAPLAAMQRELEEEIGVDPASYDVIASRGGYRYTIPEEYRKPGGWIGQEQTYFLCRYKGEGREGEFRLDCGEPEFIRVMWIDPEEFRLDWLPPFKREVYRQVFQDLFGIRKK